MLNIVYSSKLLSFVLITMFLQPWHKDLLAYYCFYYVDKISGGSEKPRSMDHKFSFKAPVRTWVVQLLISCLLYSDDSHSLKHLIVIHRWMSISCMDKLPKIYFYLKMKSFIFSDWHNFLYALFWFQQIIILWVNQSWWLTAWILELDCLQSNLGSAKDLTR